MVRFRGNVLRPPTLHIRGEYHQRLGRLWVFCTQIFQGVAQLVARTAGGREVASSSLVTLTT